MTQIFSGATKPDDYIRVAQLAEVQAQGSLLVYKKAYHCLILLKQYSLRN